MLKLEKHFKTLQAKLLRPFTDIEASYLAMVQDISKVNERTKYALSKVGEAIPIQGVKPKSLWTALAGLTERLEAVEANHDTDLQEMEHLKFNQAVLDESVSIAREEFSELQLTLEQMSSWMSGTDNTIRIFQ